MVTETRKHDSPMEKDIKNIHESIFWDEEDPRWFKMNVNYKPKGRLIKGQSIDLSKDSYIICFEGWRGAGKTTAMTFFAMLAEYLGNMRLLANYPIEYRLIFANGSSRIVKAEPLDLYKLLCFSPEYKNCLIVIDEAPDIISHMSAVTWKNRLMNVFVRELRKNRNSLFVGAQQLELLDKSFRWQVDVICHCEDASRKYDNNDLDRGECVFLDFMDNSGMWTGKSFEEEKAYLRARGEFRDPAEQIEIWPRVLWGDDKHKPVYDTYFQQDVWESLKKVDINIGNYEVGNNVTDKPEENNYFTIALAAAQAMTTDENKVISSKDFYNEIGDLSNKDKQKISKAINNSGVQKRVDAKMNRYYDFTNFDIAKFRRELMK